MKQSSPLLALVRQSITDPVLAGRAIIALNPRFDLRWMLLAAAILVSVVLIYVLPVLSGQADQMLSPWSFAAGQAGLNLLVVFLVAYVGRAFGGTGSFADALLLMGWLQAVTVAMLIAQLVALIVLPFLSLPVTMASIIISLWMLTGFICALHGFQSRALVLVGGVMVFTITTFVLAFILLLLGFDFSGVSDV